MRARPSPRWRARIISRSGMALAPAESWMGLRKERRRKSDSKGAGEGEDGRHAMNKTIRASELHTGDVVRLSAGGPRMTVNGHYPGTTDIQCVWFDQKADGYVLNRARVDVMAVVKESDAAHAASVTLLEEMLVAALKASTEKKARARGARGT